MKQKKALYEDVVIADGTKGQSSQSHPATHRSTKTKNHDKNLQRKQSERDTKKPGKDEQSQTDLEKRAEKINEDPYLTSAEMTNLDGGTKEKEKENEKEEADISPQEKSKKELDIIASRAEKILFRAKTVFPFDFFPDTIIIDANKVDICLKSFFATETVTSIMLKEIMDVRVNVALFLATLVIDYGPHPLKIKTVFVSQLLKKDALKAKEIIEGMLILYRGENIDTAKLKPEEAMDEIKEVGRIEEP